MNARYRDHIAYTGEDVYYPITMPENLQSEPRQACLRDVPEVWIEKAWGGFTFRQFPKGRELFGSDGKVLIGGTTLDKINTVLIGLNVLNINPEMYEEAMDTLLKQYNDIRGPYGDQTILTMNYYAEQNVLGLNFNKTEGDMGLGAIKKGGIHSLGLLVAQAIMHCHNIRA